MVSSLFKRTLTMLIGDVDAPHMPNMNKRPLKALTERELLSLESEIGARLFGPIPEGHSRQFFCLDPKTWIWYEEWIDENKKKQTSTVRYEVQEKGILKVQEGARYKYLEGEELQNLVAATTMYYELVARHIYRRDPDTGEPSLS